MGAVALKIIGFWILYYISREGGFLEVLTHFVTECAIGARLISDEFFIEFEIASFFL